jgi:hypothetical protein
MGARARWKAREKEGAVEVNALYFIVVVVSGWLA